MKRLIVLAFTALSVLSHPVRAQDSQSVTIPVDRIVAQVGRTPILWSEVLEQLNVRRAQGLQIPEDPAAQVALARGVLNEMVDAEVLVQRALLDTTVVVEDVDLQQTVDARLKQVRAQFGSDQEMAQALRADGFGTVEEYRRWITDQARRNSLQQKYVQTLRQAGRVIKATVSEAEITDAFNREKERLPKRPATVTFRQLVIPTTASDTAKRLAYIKTDSILKELRDGGDFEKIAKRVSEDSGSAVQGGDLGWNRRGVMVPAFDAMMFFLPPGQVSPIVETPFGFHIIRVDRVQPSERKARHILIKPTYDSLDIERTRTLADSALAQWKRGTSFDTLVARYHDTVSDEARGVLEPFERSKLPESYQEAFDGKSNGDFIGPFVIEDRSRGVPKFVVAQLIEAADEGEYTVQDLRNQIRDQLAEEKSMRRLLDGLRKETFVAIMLDQSDKKGAGSL